MDGLIMVDLMRSALVHDEHVAGDERRQPRDAKQHGVGDVVRMA
jgi:hypothetical protein